MITHTSNAWRLADPRSSRHHLTFAISNVLFLLRACAGYSSYGSTSSSSKFGSIIIWLLNCRGGDLRASIIPPEAADQASAAAARYVPTVDVPALIVVAAVPAVYMCADKSSELFEICLLYTSPSPRD